MNVIAFILGTIIPASIGWLPIRMFERNAPVLKNTERWILGTVMGTTLTMYLFFLGESIGIMKFSAMNMLLLSIIFLAVLLWFWLRMREYWKADSPDVAKSTSIKSLPTWIKILLSALAVLTIVKIVTATILLVGSPAYLDDVYKNWNMRGKVFYVTQEMHLNSESVSSSVIDTGVYSYPPSVPLTKTWLASLAGGWNEGLVNSPHILWYLIALALVFFFLRRHVNLLWSLAGVYGLSSLPLFLIHGASAYADIFVAIHVFAAVSMLYNAIKAKESDIRLSYLRLSTLFAALLIFTKNEALLLHLPTFIALFIGSLAWMRYQSELSKKETRLIFFHSIAVISLVLLPWLIFKWSHGLSFGNAHEVSGLSISWQPRVLYSVYLNTIMEGNWSLLFPVLLGLLIIKWKSAFLSPLVILVGYFCILYFGQLLIFMFTSLSVEALKQTGYARGIIQLAPIAIVIIILLMTSFADNKSDH